MGLKSLKLVSSRAMEAPVGGSLINLFITFLEGGGGGLRSRSWS
jgi:hypothetical protein